MHKVIVGSRTTNSTIASEINSYLLLQLVVSNCCRIAIAIRWFEAATAAIVAVTAVVPSNYKALMLLRLLLIQPHLPFFFCCWHSLLQSTFNACLIFFCRVSGWVLAAAVVVWV